MSLFLCYLPTGTPHSTQYQEDGEQEEAKFEDTPHHQHQEDVPRYNYDEDVPRQNGNGHHRQVDHQYDAEDGEDLQNVSGQILEATRCGNAEPCIIQYTYPCEIHEGEEAQSLSFITDQILNTTIIQREEEKVNQIIGAGETFGSIKRTGSRFSLYKAMGEDHEVYRVSTDSVSEQSFILVPPYLMNDKALFKFP